MWELLEQEAPVQRLEDRQAVADCSDIANGHDDLGHLERPHCWSCGCSSQICITSYPIIHLPVRLLVHLMCRCTIVAWPLLLVLRCTDEGMLS